MSQGDETGPWSNPREGPSANPGADAPLEYEIGEDEILVVGEELVKDEPTPIEIVACWRCGKDVEVGSTCPRCKAPPASALTSGTGERRGGPIDLTANLYPRLILCFAGLLGTSVIYGWLGRFGLAGDEVVDVETARRHLYQMVGLEAVDTVLILAALAWVPRPPTGTPVSRRRKIATWALGPVALIGALAMNFAYHDFLRHSLHLPAVEDAIVAQIGLTFPLILAYCIQPAILEELFFRHLTQGNLRRHLGVHGAVIASSIMFGMCHIGVPLSIPVLTLVGVIFGYARVLSGSLALPILLHFGHNLAIIFTSSP